MKNVENFFSRKIKGNAKQQPTQLNNHYPCSFVGGFCYPCSFVGFFFVLFFNGTDAC
jgi:hypothetical protein